MLRFGNLTLQRGSLLLEVRDFPATRFQLILAVVVIQRHGVDAIEQAPHRNPLAISRGWLRAAPVLQNSVGLLNHDLWRRENAASKLSLLKKIGDAMLSENALPRQENFPHLDQPNTHPGGASRDLSFYFYSHRLSATGYIYTYGLMESHPNAGKMQQEMIAEIERAKPKFLVLVNGPSSWRNESTLDRTSFEWTTRYARRFYRPVGMVERLLETETRAATIECRWDGQAAHAKPRSGCYIGVLQRKP
jgi:hypothetical protein